MKYFLIAGEASGDLHAAHLMQALKQIDTAAQFRYFGGEQMQAVGGELLVHYRDLAYMGFVQVALHLPTILRGMKLCRQSIVQWQPDVVILIDYPGFNLKMAQFVKSTTSVRCSTTFRPNLGMERAPHPRHSPNVDRLFSILPFEVPFSKTSTTTPSAMWAIPRSMRYRPTCLLTLPPSRNSLCWLYSPDRAVRKSPTTSAACSVPSLLCQTTR